MTTLIANMDERTLSGKVLPFGEIGYTNVGAVLASAESDLSWPDTVILNREHDGETFKCGSGTLEKRDDGIYATFSVDDTPYGDVVLLEAAEGKRNAFSIEIPKPVIRASKIISGVIDAVAAVVKPAFKSALMAADAGDLAELPDWMQPAESTTDESEEVVIDGVTYIRKTTRSHKTTVEVKEGADMPENQIDETTDNAKVDLTAAFGEFLKNHKNDNDKPKMTAAKAFKAIANGVKTGGLEAALVDIVHDDNDNDGDGLGEIASAPAWLGEVYNNAAYQRRFIPLLTTGNLTSYRELGFQWSTKPTVAPYAGNKTAVPSTGMTAEPVAFGTQRWANAADLDRRFIDFGDQDVVRAFIEANIESYREVTDLDALQRTIDAATAVETGDLVTGVNPALVRIVDGVLALVAANKRPTSAVVGMADYRSLLLTPKDQIAEFLSQSMGAESGSVLGFQIVPSANEDVQDAALVLDKSTVRYKEFGGGSPVRIQAEHLANGGVDVGIFGYTSHQVLNEDGIVLVSDPVEAG